MLHPPLLQKKSSGIFIIVSGKKRILAAEQCHAPQTVTALVIPEIYPQDLSFHYLLQHALIGNQLSIVEQALFFEKSLRKIKKTAAIGFLETLGHKRQTHLIDNFLKILKLEDSLILRLHEGKIHPKTLRIIEKLSFPDQKEIGELIIRLKLGGSKQLKLAEWCYELMMRKKISLKMIINQWQDQLETTDEKNTPQLTNGLFQWLSKQCYPDSTEAELEFNCFVATLELGKNKNIQVSHTQSFEDDSISLSIGFKDRNKLKAAWKKIKNVLAA